MSHSNTIEYLDRVVVTLKTGKIKFGHFVEYVNWEGKKSARVLYDNTLTIRTVDLNQVRKETK